MRYIALALTYILAGTVGSFLLAKDCKREFGIIQATDTPYILVCGLVLGYCGLAAGLLIYFAPSISKFVSAHTKRLTVFLNKITDKRE